MGVLRSAAHRRAESRFGAFSYRRTPCLCAGFGGLHRGIVAFTFQRLVRFVTATCHIYFPPASPARRALGGRNACSASSLVVRVAAQMPNEAMTEAQKKKKMEADRQKKNEQKELDNLNRVFEWCVRPTASACMLPSAHA